MKKILYIMHVDWDWIKQRPHFIAENLSEHYEVLILYPYTHMRWKLTKNSREDLNIRYFIPIPFDFPLKAIKQIHKLYFQIYLKKIVKHFQPDLVWLTFPLAYQFLPQPLPCRVVYDCMDHAASFRDDEVKKSELIRIEDELLQDSWKIFTSSERLKNHLETRVTDKNKIKLVRNAFGDKIINEKQKKSKSGNEKSIYKIGYIGTISTWFDFESLDYCIEHIPNIEFHMLGPVESKSHAKKFKNSYKFYGPLEHRKLYQCSLNFDILIMPFLITPLVQSVDPVKLYEYINYNKPIIASYYDEIKRFSPFVHFYSNREELKQLLMDMINGKLINKYSFTERKEFLKSNTWESRVKDVVNILEEENK